MTGPELVIITLIILLVAAISFSIGWMQGYKEGQEDK